MSNLLDTFAKQWWQKNLFVENHLRYLPFITNRTENDEFTLLFLNSFSIVLFLVVDMGMHGEIPKLYCTNLPENCKAHDLQRLFSSFGQVTDCVILWDYYAFITYKSFFEAERALMTLNGFTWKDRHLIVEWARASGRRQQQQSSPTPPRLVGMFDRERGFRRAISMKFVSSSWSFKFIVTSYTTIDIINAFICFQWAILRQYFPA